MKNERHRLPYYYSIANILSISSCVKLGYTSGGKKAINMKEKIMVKQDSREVKSFRKNNDGYTLRNDILVWMDENRNSLIEISAFNRMKFVSYKISDIFSRNTILYFHKYALWNLLPNTLKVSYSIEPLIRFIVQIKMLKNNKFIIHSGGADINRIGVIWAAWDNVGKTYVSNKLSRDGFRIYSDDMNIIDKRYMYQLFPYKEDIYVPIEYNYIFFLIKDFKKMKIYNVNNVSRIVDKIVSSTYHSLIYDMPRRFYILYSQMFDTDPAYLINKPKSLLYNWLKRIIDNVYIIRGNREFFYRKILEVLKRDRVV